VEEIASKAAFIAAFYFQEEGYNPFPFNKHF